MKTVLLILISLIQLNINAQNLNVDSIDVNKEIEFNTKNLIESNENLPEIEEQISLPVKKDRFKTKVKNALNFIPIILQILLLIVGIIALFIYSKLIPRVHIDLLPDITKIDKYKSTLVLKIEIKNHSRVRIFKRIVRLQVLEYDLTDDFQLSEWVPFSKDKIMKNEKPLKWIKPIEIFKTTEAIYPNGRISGDRLYTFKNNRIIHVGLQLKGRLGFLAKLSNFKYRSTIQFTETRIIKI